MKQTAVEWLVEYIHSAEYQMAFGVNYISPVVVDKALEMEKEQLKELEDFETWKEWKNTEK